MPIDIINGTNKLRIWIENNGDLAELDSLENFDMYKQQLEEIKVY